MKAFIFPKSKRSGALKNSMAFIVAIIMICANAHKRGLMELIIHIAINISAVPIVFVSMPACCDPKILATIN